MTEVAQGQNGRELLRLWGSRLTKSALDRLWSHAAAETVLSVLVG
jgi:hypothetical protein